MSQKIWFVQVKRNLCELPLLPSDAQAVFEILLWALGNPDTAEVDRTLFSDGVYDRLLDLEIVLESGLLNRAVLSNSKHDRNFLQPGAAIVRHRG